MSKFFKLATVLLLSLGVSSALAKPISEDKIPQSLLPWVDWVKHSHPELDCPMRYSNQQRDCVWPGELEIRASKSGAKFQQKLTVYKQSEVRLPGDRNNWPVNVKANNEVLVVVERNGAPYVMFNPGNYQVSGEFSWRSLPASLAIDSGVGIVRYYLNGKEVRLPQIRKSSLWLRNGQGTNISKAPQDKLKIEVYRLVADGHPLNMTTHLAVEVSGKQREVVLGKPILDGFIPLRIESSLPARLESDGSLRAQVRPGRWVFKVHSRHPDNITKLPYQNGGVDASWPDSEVWVYRSSPKDRQTEIEGVRQIDPRQVRLPNIWANLPAFEIKQNSEFVIKVNRRGDPIPEPDSLSLSRDMWLDFDGAGLTVKDQISGKMTSGWRLSVEEDFSLGRVVINGKPQFITRLNEEGRNGVEVRRGKLNLVAESRFENNLLNVSATGWGRDFQQVNSNLHLPPGYQVLAVGGVDNVPASWIQRWTLYDIFLVLIIALGVGKLWSWKWVPLALITTMLVWHEPGAPKMIWLFLLAIIALLRVVPTENRFYQYLKALRIIGLLILLVIVLPFMVQQAREAIYPQLEKHWVQPITPSIMHQQVDMMANEDAAYLGKGRLSEMASSIAEPAYRAVKEAKKYQQSRTLDQIDPSATIQTGPGLPNWNWRTVKLYWNGPVAQGQHISIYLLGPVASLILSFFSIGLLLVMAWRFLDIKPNTDKLSLKVIFAALVALFSVNSNAAEFPPQELLNQLEQRLIEPTTSAPRASVPVLSLNYAQDHYTAAFEVQALENTAVPLPVDMSLMAPVNVVLDGNKVVNQLYRNKQNQLWLLVPQGRQMVELAVYLPQLDQLQIPLPIKPFKVMAQGQGWTLEGVNQNGRPQQQLSLIRVRDKTETKQGELAPSVLPPFLRVERTLQFGLQWEVFTRVTRLSPSGSPISVQVPVVSGASVVTDGLNVENGLVQVNMAAAQSEVVWRSRLDPADSLTLQAPDNQNWIEVWRADIGSIWHADIEGIAPIHHQDSGRTWLPAWHPWPGEKVTFNIQRPLGVAGDTATIDYSQLTVKPGKRATDSTLSFSLRSSQGGKRDVTLPEDSELLSVKVNGRTQPIRLEGQTVSLPVVPGQQSYEITWRSKTGLSTQWQTPQISLGGDSVNATITVNAPKDRWTLWLAGPSLGPAVLFWGVISVLVLLAVILGRVGSGYLPVGITTWMLLGFGLSQVSVFALVLVAAWFFAMYFRIKAGENPGFEKHWFNLLQILLAVLTVITAVVLLGAVQNGLLGQPAMLIQGNNSSSYLFNWYQDRVSSQYPQATVLSMPLWVYRALMMAWALWLAFSLLSWIKWGWQAYSTGGLWRKVSLKINRPHFGGNKDKPQDSKTEVENS